MVEWVARCLVVVDVCVWRSLGFRQYETSFIALKLDMHSDVNYDTSACILQNVGRKQTVNTRLKSTAFLVLQIYKY